MYVPAQLPSNENAIHQLVLPFKGQKLADTAKKQLPDMIRKSVSRFKQCPEATISMKTLKYLNPHHL